MKSKYSCYFLIPFLLSALFLFIQPAESRSCDSCRVNSFDDVADIAAMLIPAQYINGADYQDTSRFANGRSVAEMDRNYGATGTIECEGKVAGSANIVGRRDVLVTAGHVLYDNRNGCRPYEDCVFVTSMNGRRVERRITSNVRGAPPRTCPFSNDLDWAVATLSSGVPDGIEPYQVGDPTALADGDRVLAVHGASGDFIRTDSNGNLGRPKAFSECSMRGPGAGAFLGLMTTDCSAAVMASGSSLLNSNRQIVAIEVQNTEPLEELLVRLNTMPFRAKRCDFSPTTCATYNRPIDGDFLKAIQTATTSVGI